MRRVRTGEALAGIAAVALFCLLFLNWFSGAGVSASGWSTLGWALVALLAIVLALTVVVVGAAATGAKPAIAVGAIVIDVALSAVTLLIALIRVLITQPALDRGLPNSAVSVQAPGYLGLAALALITVGCWRAMADERVDAPESAYTPPPPRPLPHA